MIEITQGRPLFPNPMDEPVFYRRAFREWVSEAIKEKQTEGGVYDKIMNDAQTGKITKR